MKRWFLEHKAVALTVTSTRRWKGRGVEPSSLEVPIGRLYGLRADIVHKGVANPPLLGSGYYVLEKVARTLIRGALGVTTDWPTGVGENNWPEPVRSVIEDLRTQRHRTLWEP